MADAPLFVYIPQLNKSAHVSIGQFWSIDLQTAVTQCCNVCLAACRQRMRIGLFKQTQGLASCQQAGRDTPTLIAYVP